MYIDRVLCSGGVLRQIVVDIQLAIGDEFLHQWLRCAGRKTIPHDTTSGAGDEQAARKSTPVTVLMATGIDSEKRNSPTSVRCDHDSVFQ